MQQGQQEGQQLCETLPRTPGLPSARSATGQGPFVVGKQASSGWSTRDTHTVELGTVSRLPSQPHAIQISPRGSRTVKEHTPMVKGLVGREEEEGQGLRGGHPAGAASPPGCPVSHPTKPLQRRLQHPGPRSNFRYSFSVDFTYRRGSVKQTYGERDGAGHLMQKRREGHDEPISAEFPCRIIKAARPLLAHRVRWTYLSPVAIDLPDMATVEESAGPEGSGGHLDLSKTHAPVPQTEDRSVTCRHSHSAAGMVRTLSRASQQEKI